MSALTPTSLLNWWGTFDTSHHVRLALQKATFYWIGYLTCQLGRSPTSNEVKKKVSESWEAFLDEPKP